jgi:hypothetical protein
MRWSVRDLDHEVITKITKPILKCSWSCSRTDHQIPVISVYYESIKRTKYPSTWSLERSSKNKRSHRWHWWTTKRKCTFWRPSKPNRFMILTYAPTTTSRPTAPRPETNTATPLSSRTLWTKQLGPWRSSSTHWCTKLKCVAITNANAKNFVRRHTVNPSFMIHIWSTRYTRNSCNPEGRMVPNYHRGNCPRLLVPLPQGVLLRS